MPSAINRISNTNTTIPQSKMNINREKPKINEMAFTFCPVKRSWIRTLLWRMFRMIEVMRS